MICTGESVPAKKRNLWIGRSSMKPSKRLVLISCVAGALGGAVVCGAIAGAAFYNGNLAIVSTMDYQAAYDVNPRFGIIDCTAIKFTAVDREIVVVRGISNTKLTRGGYLVTKEHLGRGNSYTDMTADWGLSYVPGGSSADDQYRFVARGCQRTARAQGIDRISY